MSFTLRTKAELKFKNKDDGKKITYQFDRSLEPFEIAKAMMVLHASNHGIVKLKDDMGNFLTQFLRNSRLKKSSGRMRSKYWVQNAPAAAKMTALKKGG